MGWEFETLAISDWAELVDRHVVEGWVVLNAGHLGLELLGAVMVVGEAMALPDTGGLLEVDGFLVADVGLGLMEVALLDEFLDEVHEHAWVAGEEVLDLVQGHVLGVVGGLEGPLDEVVGGGYGDEVLEFREVLRVKSVIFD